MSRDHDCLEHLLDRPDDPNLPRHISLMECDVCGERFERDHRYGEIAPAE